MSYVVDLKKMEDVITSWEFYTWPNQKVSSHKNVTQVLIYRELEGFISFKEYPVYGFKPNQKVSSHKKCHTKSKGIEGVISNGGWFKPNRTNQKVSSPVKACAARLSVSDCVREKRHGGTETFLMWAHTHKKYLFWKEMGLMLMGLNI